MGQKLGSNNKYEQLTTGYKELRRLVINGDEVTNRWFYAPSNWPPNPGDYQPPPLAFPLF